MADQSILELTTEIVAAHVSNNRTESKDVPALIHSVFTALIATANPVIEEVKREPAVPIRSSIKPDYIVCLEDGAKLKMLKRYLRTKFDMSPEEYRAKWGLPRDYPMVAPNYAEQRRSLAHSIGLGRKKVTDSVEAVAKKVETAAPVVAAPVVKAAKTVRKKLGIATGKAADPAQPDVIEIPAPEAVAKPAAKPRAKKPAPATA